MWACDGCELVFHYVSTFIVTYSSFHTPRWADIYCNTVPTLVANINPANGGLIRGVNGPWSHNLPHMGFPGPKVDWLSETIKWWNYCLRGDKAMEAMWKASPMYSGRSKWIKFSHMAHHRQ